MEQSTLEVIQCIGEVMPFGVVDMPNLSRSINNKKVTGHHAIIPTSRIKSEKIDDLPTGEKNILSLISLRLLCAVSEPHKYESVKIIVTCEGNIFTASGRTIVDMGWKSIDAKIENSDKSEQGQDESQLPDIEKGMTFEKVPAKKSVHFTSPPKSFTEDTLLSAMEHASAADFDENAEKKGIGTPATRAVVIEELVAHKYVKREGKKLLLQKMAIN